MLHELGLCAGIAGISYGLRQTGHFRTVCYVERNPYRQAVIQQRIQDGWLDDAPIWDDVTTFDGRPWHGIVDIISAGFPCQPFSIAGKKLRENDARHLWPDIIRIIREVRPQYIILENVLGLLMGDVAGKRPAPISTVLAELSESGFDAEWDVLPAAAFGAPHMRERIFIIAYARERRRQKLLRNVDEVSFKTYPGWLPAPLDNVFDLVSQLEQRVCEPSVFGSNDGLPYRVERLEAIGEAVVPDIARYIGECIAREECLSA